MSALITAILASDIQAVRTLAATQPRLLQARSFDGLLPLELADRKGRVDIVVTLLRTNAPGHLSRTDTDLLIAYISEISGEVAYAGWLNNIEYELWHLLLTGKPHADDPFQFASYSEMQDDLRFLSERCQGWISYGRNGAELISLPEWRQRYEDWRQAQV